MTIVLRLIMAMIIGFGVMALSLGDGAGWVLVFVMFWGLPAAGAMLLLGLPMEYALRAWKRDGLTLVLSPLLGAALISLLFASKAQEGGLDKTLLLWGAALGAGWGLSWLIRPSPRLEY